MYEIFIKASCHFESIFAVFVCYFLKSSPSLSLIDIKNVRTTELSVQNVRIMLGVSGICDLRLECQPCFRIRKIKNLF